MENQLNKFIMVVIVIIIVFAIGIIYSQNITNSQTKYTATNAQFMASNTSCTNLNGNNCIVTLTSINNATSGSVIGAGNYTQCNINGNYYQGVIMIDGGSRYNGLTLNTTFDYANCAYSPVNAPVFSLLIALFWICVTIFGVFGLIIFIKRKR